MNFFYLAFSLLLSLNTAVAFTFNNSVGASFDGDQVTVNVAANCDDTTLSANTGLTANEILSMAHEGVNDYWNRAPTSRLTLNRGSVVSVAAAFSTAAICTGSGSSCTPNTALTVASGILISCNDDSTSGGSPNFNSNSVLGVTVPNNISGHTIQGALILINAKSGTGILNRSHDEMVAVLAHEIGHAVGLGHSPVTDSLMYFQSIPTRRSLGWDDIDGISYLYPASQPVSCGSINLTDDLPRGGTGLLVGLTLSMLLAGVLKSRLRKLKA